MYKLLLFYLMSVSVMSMYALQTDEELAMHSYFLAKHGLNRAVHAAVQQEDMFKLSQGIRSIDEGAALTAALEYVRANLRLDTSNAPLPNTFFRARVQIEDFTIVNENETFPYLYRSGEYSVTLRRPGAIMRVLVEYPPTFSLLRPVVWRIHAAAEMVD